MAARRIALVRQPAAILSRDRAMEGQFAHTRSTQRPRLLVVVEQEETNNKRLDIAAAMTNQEPASRTDIRTDRRYGRAQHRPTALRQDSDR